MGFLNILGDIAGLLPIPGAGIAGDILKGVGSTSSVLGAQQQGKAKGAAAEAQLQSDRDRNAIALYNAQQQAQNQAAQTDLERQQFATNDRGQAARQALVGALLGGGYKGTVPGAAISSGLLKSLNGNPAALAAMNTLGQQGSTAQNTPLSFTGGSLVAPPTLSSLPNVSGSGALSTIANIGQLAGAASPSFMDILKKIQQQSAAKGSQVQDYSDVQQDD